MHRYQMEIGFPYFFRSINRPLDELLKWGDQLNDNLLQWIPWLLFPEIKRNRKYEHNKKENP